MKRFSTRSIALSSLVISGICLIAVGLGPVFGESNGISSCVNKKTGAIKIADKCLKTEYLLTWNKEGPQGPRGEMGIAGPPGPVGPQGSQGPAGSNTTSTVVQSVSQKAYDANSNLIGTVLGVSDQSLTASINGSTVSYFVNSGVIVQNAEFVYLSPGCTGDKYHYAQSGVITYSDSSPGISSIWDNAKGAALVGSYIFGKSEGPNVDRPLTVYYQEANNGVVSCLTSTDSVTSDSYTINNKLKKFVSTGKNFTISFPTPFSYRTN
jgi:hypothetical protein